MIAPLLAAALLLGAAPARAMSDADAKTVERGLDAVYKSDYDGAVKVFDDALKAAPGDPALSLGAATAAWWRMENNFALPGSPEEKPFLALVKNAVDDAKRATKGADPAEGYLYLGAAYGIKGRWEASQHHWFSAYLDGRRSYRYEKKAVKLNPELYDAYLGLGAFDYYVATLSGFIRALAFASGGDKLKGLAELRLAAEKGRFGRIAARMLLVGIDWTFEKNPQRARAAVDEMSKLYPDSPMMDSMRLIALFHLRDADGLRREARACLEKAERGAPFYGPLDRAGAHYFLGVAEQFSGNPERALGEYQAALKDIPETHKLRGLVYLFIGEATDLADRREEAKDYYRRALAQPPLWGVPRYAHYLLSRPYRAGDDPLPPRNTALQ